MLPRRKPKERSKPYAGPLRCPGHLAYVRGFMCAVESDSCQGPIEAAHLRLGTHTGIGQKPSDDMAIPLCRHHHAEAHQGEATFQGRHRLNWAKMAAELARRSPAWQRMLAKRKAEGLE